MSMACNMKGTGELTQKSVNKKHRKETGHSKSTGGEPAGAPWQLQRCRVR